MSNDKPEYPIAQPAGKGHGVMIAALSAGLVVALSMDGFLLVRSNQLRGDIAQSRQSTQAQISKLGDAATALLEQRMDAINREIKSADDAASAAVNQARSDTARQSKA
ncbi:MAG: hypothetical protein ACRD30_06705, partial [Bryobacteraceae bacterium]